MMVCWFPNIFILVELSLGNRIWLQVGLIYANLDLQINANLYQELFSYLILDILR